MLTFVSYEVYGTKVGETSTPLFSEANFLSMSAIAFCSNEEPQYMNFIWVELLPPLLPPQAVSPPRPAAASSDVAPPALSAVRRETVWCGNAGLMRTLLCGTPSRRARDRFLGGAGGGPVDSGRGNRPGRPPSGPADRH